MRYLSVTDEPSAEVDVTPLIDIVFQLIIFFMVVGQMVAQETIIEITIPLSTQADTQVVVADGRLTIQMMPDRQVYVGRTGPHTISRAALVVRDFAREYRARMGVGPDELLDLPVLVRVDQETEYGDFRQVMGICMENKLWRTWWVANPPRN